MVASGETVLWGCSLDYSGRGGASYVTGGSIPGSALDTFQQNIHKTVSIMHIGGHAWMQNGVFNTFSIYITNLNILTAAGVLPCIDWLPFDSGGHTNDFALRPSRIAAGDWDTQITAYAQAIKNWGKDICIRTFVESNIIGQYPWQYGPTGSWLINGTAGHTPNSGYSSGTWTNTTADVVGAYQRIGNIFKNVVGAYNAKLILNLNIISNAATITVASQVDAALPYIDIMSIDGYTDRTGTTTDYAAIYRGGTGTGLQDTYGLMAARHPTMPMMLSETGFAGTVGGTIGITALTRSGGNWTLTLASTPNAAAVATAAFDVVGVSPTTYNGEWNIISGSGTGPWVIAGNSDHGAATVSGATVQVIDRPGRAANVTKSFEIDLPTLLQRIKYILLFWVGYDANNWLMDYNGSQPNNVDMKALARAIGNAHYLSGGNLGTDVSSVQFIPYQDQPLTSSGARNRYSAVCHSTSSLVGAWNLRDSAGTTTVADDSGNGRTGAVTGSLTLGAASLIPSEPTWTSASFPGPTTPTVITIADNTVFSANLTNGLGIGVTFQLPAAPLGTAVLVAKTVTGSSEYSIFLTPTTINCTCFQLTGGTYASASFPLPTSYNVPHHVVASIDTTNSASPLTFYLDGVGRSSIAAAGSMGNGSAPVTIGQLSDGTQPMPAGGLISAVWIWNAPVTAESVGDQLATWNAGPVITVGPNAA